MNSYKTILCGSLCLLAICVFSQFSNLTPIENLTWQEYGPGNRGGRTRTIIVDKFSSNILYAGSIGGGVWVSYNEGASWYKKSNGLSNYIISTLYQSGNGTLYAGTGEYFGFDGGLSFKGNGIFKSTDKAENWVQIPSTNNNDFTYVMKIAGYGSKIFAATWKGLRVSTDEGNSWINPIPDTDQNYNLPATDVEVSSDGTVVAAVINNNVYISIDGGNNFSKKSGNDNNLVPVSDIIRLELAIAPSNSNYIYCLAVNSKGRFKNIYYSTDKGNNWTPLYQTVTEQFQPFGKRKDKQGFYHCSINVDPVNENTIYIGGINLHKYSPNTEVIDLTSCNIPEYSTKYVHRNIHCITFSPNYQSNKTIFLATDGGIYKSVDGGNSWYAINKKYSTGSFLSISVSKNNELYGGTLYDGLIYNDLKFTEITDFKQLYFDSIVGSIERSAINPKYMILTTQYGSLYRTHNGLTFEGPSTIFPTNSKSGQNVGSYKEPLFAPVRIFENFYDTNSIQYVEYKAPKNFNVGDTIVASTYLETFLFHILKPEDLHGGTVLHKDSIIKIKNTYQILTAIGLNNSVWISWEALDPSKVNSGDSAQWFQIVKDNTIGKVNVLEFTNDGDIIYFAGYDSTTNKSKVYRSKNLQQARDSATAIYNSPTCVIETQKIGTFNGKVSGIAIDPFDNNKIIVVLSNTPDSCKVYYSENAATTNSDTLNFIKKQANLPSEYDVYCALIPWKPDSIANVVMVGTSNGLYITDDINNPNWIKSNYFENVPVMQIRQQTKLNGWLEAPGHVFGGIQTGIENHGIIYAATHGRGIFRCDNYKGPDFVPHLSSLNNRHVFLAYPNPFANILNVWLNINYDCNVNISIYTINGKKIRNYNIERYKAGLKVVTLPLFDLSSGSYIMIVNSGKEKSYGIILKK
ncbi:MAG: T9SS type A sorting domain-containing protein [Bacteroidales bacterium]|nr:T9SS type A sorting domain-containing protein [Bacteroidales bacterium]